MCKIVTRYKPLYVPLCIFNTVDAKCLEWVKTVCPVRPILPHVIRRSNIYDDVLKLFCNEGALKEFPLRIQFQDEIAVDGGGVCRDMFSAF